MAEATITSKGQVTIPAEIRKALGLAAGDRAQGAINRGRTHAQQLGLDCRVKIEVAMSLQGLHQQRYQGLEPLAAEPVGGFPQNDQNLPNGLVV